jgi:thioredoxin-related protein
MRKTILSVLFFLCVLAGYAQEGIIFDTTHTWDELLELSGKTGKLIFLDCYTSWCGPCKGMAREVFPDKKVGEFMNQTFICTKRDMEKGEGVELHKKYKEFIPGFPTYLLIDASGNAIYQVSGYLNPEKFVGKMKEGLTRESWITLSRRYEENKGNWGFLYNYLEQLEAAYQTNISSKVTARLLQDLTYKDISADSLAYKLFRKYFKDTEDSVFLSFMNNQLYRQYKDPESNINEWAGRLYNNKTKEYFKRLMDDKGEYNPVNASVLLENMKRYSFKNREEQIASVLLYNSAFAREHKLFFSLLESAKNFGLLRYKDIEISNIIRKYFASPGDSGELNDCLKHTAADPLKKFILPDQPENYAYFLDLAGKHEDAERFRRIADSIRVDIKERYKFLLKE